MWGRSRNIDKISKNYIILSRRNVMNALIAEKMALENQWNHMYLTKGVYSVDMKNIEGKIDLIKEKIIQRDIANAKINY